MTGVGGASLPARRAASATAPSVVRSVRCSGSVALATTAHGRSGPRTGASAPAIDSRRGAPPRTTRGATWRAPPAGVGAGPSGAGGPAPAHQETPPPLLLPPPAPAPP